MELKEGIINYLLEYNRSYSELRRYVYGNTRPKKGKILEEDGNRKGTLYVTLARLKKAGLVEKNGGLWKITNLGKKFLKNNKKLLKHKSRGKILTKKDLIIVFDIPEIFRSRRDWLRVELVSLGFEQMQKSVWFGPGVLPKDFLEGLSELGILKYIKFFRAEPENIV